MMILCFGIFAKIFSYCTENKVQNRFVPRVAWVIDKQNSTLSSELDFEVEDPDEMEGNPTVVSKLLSCRQSLRLRDHNLPSIEVARERFKAKVMPFINEDMIAKAVLAVRHIVSLDDTIDDTQKETFKKFLGMYKNEFLQQTSFDVPDFFARVLLYTTCVNNRDGEPYAGAITKEFIEEAVGTDWIELRWDTTAQTLDLIPSGEKRLSDWVNQLCKLRSPIIEDKEFLTTEWLEVNMTDLDPSIWGRTEIRASDAQRLLSRKINPYAHRDKSPESFLSPLNQPRCGKEQEDK